MQVKPSTLQLQSTLCTSSNSCESATNCKSSDRSVQLHTLQFTNCNIQLKQSVSTAIQTSTILKAKRCANQDRKKINGNALDTEELPKKGQSDNFILEEFSP